VSGFTANPNEIPYDVRHQLKASTKMPINFETTMTESDFARPLLNASEEQLARELHAEPDLSVDGLHGSFMSLLVKLFGAGGR
jgi:hypothetical protein